MFKKSLFLLAAVAMIGLVSCKPKADDANGDDNGDGNGNGNKTYQSSITSDVTLHEVNIDQASMTPLSLTIKINGTEITEENGMDLLLGDDFMYVMKAVVTGDKTASFEVGPMDLSEVEGGTLTSVIPAVPSTAIYASDTATVGDEATLTLTLYKVTGEMDEDGEPTKITSEEQASVPFTVELKIIETTPEEEV